jgi:hypothetical protein
LPYRLVFDLLKSNSKYFEQFDKNSQRYQDYLEFQEIVASKERLKKLYEQRCKKNKNFFSCRKYNNSLSQRVGHSLTLNQLYGLLQPSSRKMIIVVNHKPKIQVIKHTTYIGEGK